MVQLLETMGAKAKAASAEMAKMPTTQKNTILKEVAAALTGQAAYILQENDKDIETAQKSHMKPALIDRLRLTEERIQGMAEGLCQVADLDDPVGEVSSMKKRPNGLCIGKMAVPLGVVAIIYESRPNVTADAFGLCFKSGNVSLLRGGSDAICSNIAIVKVIQQVLEKRDVCTDVVQLLTDTSHEVVQELLHLNAYIDVVIPRGSAGLIRTVVENSTVPVIETGTGNCHIYVDASADLDMAVRIINNAKTQRVGVCNACESLVIHQDILQTVLPKIIDKLQESSVEVRGDKQAMHADARVVPASEDDWGREYLDYIISVRTVSSLDEAIEHINSYNTGHSESIITENYGNAQRFLNEIDAACVYVNASTRFTDGFEFGFGAEIGISTQKLHVRGPMGLKELTTNKYIVYGNGQIR